VQFVDFIAPHCHVTLLYFLNFVLVEVVRFLVSYGLARNKNRLCKGWDNRIVQKQQQKTHK
jgi:hypothetical protein